MILTDIRHMRVTACDRDINCVGEHVGTLHQFQMEAGICKDCRCIRSAGTCCVVAGLEIPSLAVDALGAIGVTGIGAQVVFRTAILHLDVVGLILVCQVVGLHHAEAGVVTIAVERAVEDIVDIESEREVVTQIEGEVSAGDAEIADILDARDVAEVVIRLVETVCGVEAVGGRRGLGGGVVVGIVGRFFVRIRDRF